MLDGERRLIELRPDDLLEEPDVAESFEALGLFLDRQDLLHDALTGDTVTLETGTDQRTHVTVTPADRRPVGSLPPVFWVQIATGLVSLSIGAWVWSTTTLWAFAISSSAPAIVSP